MTEDMLITGIFVDPTVTVKSTAPKTMTIEWAVGKLLDDITKNAQAAYQLDSLSDDNMTIQYWPGKHVPPLICSICDYSTHAWI